MKLLADAGNTRLKLSWASAPTRTAEVATFRYDDLQAAADWVAALPLQASAVFGVRVVDEPRLARVQAALRAGMRVGMRMHPRTESPPVFRPPPVFHWLDSTAQAGGVRNGYAAPQQLGADRWAALLGVAAHERRRRGAAPPVPVLLASFGTATTLDALLPLPATKDARRDAQQYPRQDGCDGVCEDGCDYVFPGGLIVPGVDLMRQSLSRGTARLRANAAPLSVAGNLPFPELPFPDCTEDAIACGIAAAQAGALWRQWTRLGSQADPADPDSPRLLPRLYVSGGAWPGIQAEVHQWLPAVPITWLPAPVLDGLAILAHGLAPGISGQALQ